LFISGITAIITVRLALRRFRAERIWEKRLEAYIQVVVALNGMLRVVGQWIDEHIERHELTEATKEARRKQYHECHRKLLEVRAIADLLLSTNTAKLLGDLVNKLDSPARADDYFSSLDAEYGLIREATERIIITGKKALKL